MTASPNTLLDEGGFFSQLAEQRLVQWLKETPPSTAALWKAIYFKPPTGQWNHHVWTDPHYGETAYTSFNKMFPGPVKAFLLADFSLILLFSARHMENDAPTMARLEQSVGKVFFDGKIIEICRSFLLSADRPAFEALCKEKTTMHPPQDQTLKPRTLDFAPFSSTAFQEALRERVQRTESKIMVAEDDVVTAKLLANLLKQFSPKIAATAQEAVNLYAQTAPDMVLLDIGLPDISGLEVLGAITAHDPQAFVVMLTANSSEKNLKEAIAKGAKGFVAKPFTSGKLAEYTAKLPKK